MAEVKFQREFTHRLDENTRKTWPVGWSGEVSDDVAIAARKAEAAEFFGTDAAEAEAAYQAELKAAAEAPTPTVEKKAERKPKVAAGPDADTLV